MEPNAKNLEGPDFTQGIEPSLIPEGGVLLGHARGEAVLLVRRDEGIFAVGASCTHYGAPLAEGLLVERTVRCPWHHACFDLATGEAVRAPALDPISCWRIGQRAGKIYVENKVEHERWNTRRVEPAVLESVVIVGGGAAGNAAAETLRKEGYTGGITMLSADETLPCDRPNLSKGYLSGSTSEESNLLRSANFYSELEIDVRLGASVSAVDLRTREVELGHRDARLPFGALLLATGAQPARLDVAGATLPHVYYLRTVSDSRRLVAKLMATKRAVIIGASFIGLEVAASLRARNIDVDVVGREAIPMARILGPEVGTFIRRLHESHGVTFHLETTVAAIDEKSVTLANGQTLPADLVVVGIGVRPETTLAERAGLTVERGVVVNEYLETSAPNVFAAGDIARWPDRLTGELIRVEHFVVAERQGQTVARNMLGRREPFDAIPFFWTEQFDFGLAYVGHAEHWDKIEIDGALNKMDCTISYWRAGKRVAVAVVRRDLDGLRAEVEFERVVRKCDNEDPMKVLGQKEHSK